MMLAGTGCSSSDDDHPGASHLGIIAEGYQLYNTANRGKAPQSEEELAGFLDGSDLLAKYGYSSMDELLVSDRDSQPLELAIGKKLIDADGSKIIGFETQGKDGKRLVAYEAFVLEVDESEFERLIPANRR